MRVGFHLLLFLLLSTAGLGGCTLLHPHRITNPPLPAGYKAQIKAAEKAKKDGVKAAKNEEKSRLAEKQKRKDQDAADAPADATPSATPIDAAPVSAQAISTLPDKSGVKYDKHELMKKPKLKHRRYYKPVREPFNLKKSIRKFFKKLTRKRHGKPQSTPKSAPESPAAPAPTPTPTPAPVDTGLTP